MTRADLLRLLTLAAAAPRPVCMTPDGFAFRAPTPEEWAAHMIAHAMALDLAIEAKVGADERVVEDVASEDDADHLNECAPDHCAAGCPDALNRRDEPEGAAERQRRLLRLAAQMEGLL